ncbi:MAG TPA: hypothetical protein VEV84_04405 [Pyrinomonadaceae bacterium]|nr:hypothetical protein [Pyrinomonadaceae bacterium]
MKKILAIVFAVSISISMMVFGSVRASANSLSAKNQVGYIKRKSRKIYYRSKHGTKVVYYKSKRGTKKTYHKSKRVTKHTYSKTKDKVTN